MPSRELPKRTRAQANGQKMDHVKKPTQAEVNTELSEEVNTELTEESDGEEEKNKTDKQNAVDCTQYWEEEVNLKEGQAEYKKFVENEKDWEEAEVGSDHSGTTTQAGSHASDEEQSGIKRGRGANVRAARKKQKTGTKPEPQGTGGDKTRVPAQGQKVQCKALPGLGDGEVVEVLYEEKTVEGKRVQGSKEDAHVVLKSASSGQIEVHKPEALCFD